MKPVLFYTIADANNLKYAKTLENSFKKFHPNIPFHTITGEELESYVKSDDKFFYRATPIISEKYLDEYELVVKMDADQLVLGDLSYIWNTKDYDVGTVLNWNRVDPQRYGTVQIWGVLPIEYVNCGLVALRSKKFAHEWKIWCFSDQFDRSQYKEQDGLNIKIYHGNWNCRVFDHGDGPAKMRAFWGLISKGEWNRAVLRNNKIIIPKGEGPTPFPQDDTELKVIHWAGGKDSTKMNYKAYFSEEVSKKIDELIK